MNPVDPLRPEDIAKHKAAQLPPEVVFAFNECIAKNYENGVAVVSQVEVVNVIMAALACSRDSVYDNGYLNVEEIYEAAGWKVEYEKPDFGAPGAEFRFSRKKKHRV